MISIKAPALTADDALARALQMVGREPPPPYWADNWDNIVTLARWLKERGEFDESGDPVADVIYYFSKPWKYENEWNEYLQERAF